VSLNLAYMGWLSCVSSSICIPGIKPACQLMHSHCLAVPCRLPTTLYISVYTQTGITVRDVVAPRGLNVSKDQEDGRHYHSTLFSEPDVITIATASGPHKTLLRRAHLADFIGRCIDAMRKNAWEYCRVLHHRRGPDVPPRCQMSQTRIWSASLRMH